MSAKSIRIEDLRLDHSNPRISDVASQREAILKILKDQDAKLVALAESIVENGLNPMDRLLVVRSEEEPGKFIALEGNRRLAAIKILRNPAVLSGMTIRAPLKKRFEELSTEFDSANLQNLDCFEVESREDGAMWINQRHTGENGGRGIVDWSGVASARFRGNDPALQALDFVSERGTLELAVRQRIEERFPITTLDRLLSTPAVRALIGVEIVGGKLVTGLPFSEVMKPLQRIVQDLALGKVTVTQLKTQAQMVTHVRAMGSDLPDLSVASLHLVAVAELFPHLPVSDAEGSDDARRTGGGTTRPHGGEAGGGTSGGSDPDGAVESPSVKTRRSPSRGKALIPKYCVLRVTIPKIAEIEKELRKLPVANHPHAISVLFRVFMELSVDQYLTRHGISLTLKVEGDRVRDKKLSAKADEAAKHMISEGAPPKELVGLTKAMSDKHNPLHTDTLHNYVHNAFYSPAERDLTVAWDNAQPFFERLWP